MSNTEPKDVKDVKPKRGRPKGSLDSEPRTRSVGVKLNTEPGDISHITAFNYQWCTMPPVDTADREQVENRITEYFTACVENDIRPGVAGLCAALGISRTTWYYWGTGEKRDYKDLIERTRAVMEAITEQYMLQGKINPVSGIFLLKNHFGYVDKNEVVLTPHTDPLGEQQDAEALKQKYLENTYGIAPEIDTDGDDDTTKLSLEQRYLTGGTDNE